MNAETLTAWSPRMLSVLRIVSGLIFMAHGTAKHLNFPASDMSAVTVGSLGGVAGLRLGRVSDVPENDPVWAGDEEAIVRDWCARAGIILVPKREPVLRQFGFVPLACLLVLAVRAVMATLLHSPVTIAG